MFMKFKSSNESISQIVLIKVIKLPVVCWNLLGNHESFSSLWGVSGSHCSGDPAYKTCQGQWQGEGAGYPRLHSKLQGVTCSGAAAQPFLIEGSSKLFQESLSIAASLF